MGRSENEWQAHSDRTDPAAVRSMRKRDEFMAQKKKVLVGAASAKAQPSKAKPPKAAAPASKGKTPAKLKSKSAVSPPSKSATVKAASSKTATAKTATAKKTATQQKATPLKKSASTTAAKAVKAPARKVANAKVAKPAEARKPRAAAAKKAPAVAAPARPQAAKRPMKAVAAAVPKPEVKRQPATVAKAEPAKAPVPNKGKHSGFKTNEFIVYPAHGVGQIVAIEEQEIAGMSLELFVITFDKDKMTLRVPTAKLESVGMRKLAAPEVVEKAMTTLKGRARVKRTMWSRRAQEYEAKINSGDLISIAEVVRDLFRSETQPEQSYSERQLYEAALDRMARELAAVESLDERGAVQRIVEVLAKSAKGRRMAEEAAQEEADEAEAEEADSRAA